MPDDSSNPSLKPEQGIRSNVREVLAARANALENSMAELMRRLPGMLNINTYKEEPESTIDTWCWDFGKEGIHVLKSCDAPHLLIVIQQLVDRIRALERQQEEDYQRKYKAAASLVK